MSKYAGRTAEPCNPPRTRQFMDIVNTASSLIGGWSPALHFTLCDKIIPGVRVPESRLEPALLNQPQCHDPNETKGVGSEESILFRLNTLLHSTSMSPMAG